MQTNKNNTRAIVAVLALAGLGLLALSPRSSAPPRGPVNVMVGLDASKSVRVAQEGRTPLLGAGVNLVAQLGETLDPDRDHLTVFRVDWRTQEFFDATAPSDPEAFQHTVIEQMKPLPQREGTFPALFWVEVARRAEEAPHPVAILFTGDADNDDLSEASLRAMRAAGVALGKNPRVVAVYISGANPKNWARLRDIFAPLGKRLHLQEPSQMDVSPLMTELDAARPQPDDTKLAQR